MHITRELYSILLDKAQSQRDVGLSGLRDKQINSPSREASIFDIQRDLGRTFPELNLFQPGYPLHDPLWHVLDAFVAYRPDIGYVCVSITSSRGNDIPLLLSPRWCRPLIRLSVWTVQVQGMGFLAAILILVLPDEYSAFTALCNFFAKEGFLTIFRMDADEVCLFPPSLSIIHLHPFLFVISRIRVVFAVLCRNRLFADPTGVSFSSHSLVCWMQESVILS
mgnify:FL=1